MTDTIRPEDRMFWNNDTYQLEHRPTSTATSRGGPASEAKRGVSDPSYTPKPCKCENPQCGFERMKRQNAENRRE